jgi:hypothetical protein
MACIARQLDPTAIRKLQVTQMDTTVPALDHISRADREPAWQTYGLRAHATLLGM